MAVDIPIWPGSSSFASIASPTPFALYDTDAQFAADADDVAKWCALRLGYPISDVEMQDINFYACFEEAVSEYGAQLNTFNIIDNLGNLYGAPTSSNLTGQQVTPTLAGLITLAESYGTEAGSGGNVTYYTGSLSLTTGQQIYDLTDATVVSLEQGTPGVDAIEIKRFYHQAPPALARFFDPFIGSGIGTQQMLDAFGFGEYSPGVSFLMMPIYADMLRLQAIEFNDMVRRSAFSYQFSKDRVRIFPVPDTATNVSTIHFDYILKADRNNPLNSSTGGTGTISDFSNIPYNNIVYSYVNAPGKQWIRRYALALAKELLGYIRSKYSSLPIPNAEITLNGSELIANGQAEKDALIEEIKGTLEQLSRQAQLERKQAEADSMMSQINKIPMKIYIG